MKIERLMSGWRITDYPQELVEAVKELEETLPYLKFWYGIDYPYKLLIAFNPRFKDLREQLDQEFGIPNDGEPLPWLDLYLRFNH
jgi:hypothetical protein